MAARFGCSEVAKKEGKGNVPKRDTRERIEKEGGDRPVGELLLAWFPCAASPLPPAPAHTASAVGLQGAGTFFFFLMLLF